MKLSIIIPIYNVEKYLVTCIESITSQNCQNVELILVDDGSTDSCGDICDKYSERFSFIRVLHKANGGLVSARKAGAEIAVGDYIMPVDGDDWVEQNAILELLSLIDKNPASIITFDYYKGTENEKKIIRNIFPEGLYKRSRIEQEINMRLISPQDGVGFPTCIWGKIYKRELYLRYQMRIPNEISIGEDSALTIPYILNADSIFISDLVLYNYRVNENSMTKSRKKGFSWTVPKIRYNYLINVVRDLGYNELEGQIGNALSHTLFNVVCSHFQTNDASYIKQRKEIANNLDDDFFTETIGKGSAKIGTNDWVTLFIIKHKLIFLTYLIAKIRK